MAAHGLRDQVLHHLLEDGLDEDLALGPQVASHRLLGVLGEHVDLDVDALAGLLLRDHHLLLRVRDEHDLEPALRVVDLGDRQAGAVERDVALEDDILQDVERLGREPERQGVAVLAHVDDLGRRVDVALDEVAAHARVSSDRALQIHIGFLLQLAQVRQPQRLGRDPDTEAGHRILHIYVGGRQAHAVDRDAVA